MHGPNVEHCQDPRKWFAGHGGKSVQAVWGYISEFGRQRVRHKQAVE